MKTRLVKFILIGILILSYLTSIGLSVTADEINIKEPLELTEEQIIKEAALDEYTTSELVKVSDTQYVIDYPGTKSRIEIGSVDKETVEFKPDLTVKHWDNEVSFSLIAPVSIDSKSELTADMYSDFVTDKVVASNGEWSFEYYAVEPYQEFNEYGGIDIIITAKEKPASNKIYFTYDSKTVTPYYQGELTPEEIKEGAYRPEHVVGSIAFYADGKANHALGSVNYATGKVGHLYAMRAGEEWCRWSIEGEYIVLTIPDAVFNGKYPVIISPVGDTFGYTTIGGSYSSFAANTMRANIYTGAAGTATSLSLYCASSDVLGDAYYRGIIYKDSDDSRVTWSAQIKTNSTTGAWRDLDVTDATISAVDYKIGAWLGQELSSYYPRIWYDSGATLYRDDETYHATNAPPDTFSEDSSLADRKISIYCTYTPSAGNDPPTVTSDSSSNVEETTATLTGNITDTGGENADIRGFQWGTSTSVYSTNVTESGDYGTGQYSLGATSLPEGDLIYWRAMAHNSEGWGYGSELTLHTKPQAPTGLSDTGRTSASIYLEWTKGTGSENTTIRYRTDQYPTDYNDGTFGYNGTASAANVTGLNPGQLYYFRAWAISTDSGNTYSDNYSQDTGYTLPADPANLALSNATCETLDADWTAGTGGDKSMVRWKTGSYPADETDGTQAYFDTSNSTTITGLPDNTTIYVAVFAYDSDSGYYSSGSSQDNEATLASSNPTVTTDNATDITNTTARLNATISSLDCEDADDTFWEWGLSTGNYTDNYTDTTDRGNGAVYYDLTGLTANTTYFYRGCARLSGGAYQCGGEISFTTTNVTICAAPVDLILTKLSDDRILAEWTAVENVTSYLLLVSTVDYPADPADQYGYAVAYSGNATTATLEGYYADYTVYYFSLWTYCNPYSDDYVTASIGGESLDDLALSFQNLGILTISMIPLIFFSVMAFWKENSVMFMLAAGVAILVGFNCYDVETSTWMLGISLVLWAYSIACLIFGFMCMFKRSPTD